MKTAVGIFSLILAGCSGSGAAAPKPDLPQSVPPGWTQQNYAESAPPGGLPQTGEPPKCWLATYSGPGQAEVRICAYRTEAPAFDAGQRFPSAANTVKFQAQKWFVVVHWSGATQTDATALVRATQKAIQK
jgi:hypothetical protein